MNEKICKNCDNWIECSDGCKGLCDPFSDMTGGEYDVFTKPNDTCVQFFIPKLKGGE